MTTVRRTRRWRGVIAVALSAGAVGLVFARPLVLLLSVVGVAYAAYPRVTSPPSVSLALDRSVTPEQPAPETDAEVAVTLRNEGTDTLADLRVVDGVPSLLGVSAGTPRHAATLRPGESTTFSYAVAAQQGTHHFESATVIARDVAGATEVETTVSTDTTIDCTAAVPDVPLRQQTLPFVGRIPTADGGSGVEFHRTREYQSGDPLGRIDWRRYARTGELATTEFRRERAAAVVLCVDAREPAYRAAGGDAPHAVAHALPAAEQLVAALADTSDAVGLASLGDAEQCWVPPAGGRDHRVRIRRTLAAHPSLAATPPAEPASDTWDDQLDALRGHLPSRAQLLLISPLHDAFPVTAAQTLEAQGHAVTVLSPGVTAEGTVGTRLADAERRNRIYSLRESGVRVVDWEPTEPLGAELIRAGERWSA